MNISSYHSRSHGLVELGLSYYKIAIPGAFVLKQIKLFLKNFDLRRKIPKVSDHDFKDTHIMSLFKEYANKPALNIYLVHVGFTQHKHIFRSFYQKNIVGNIYCTYIHRQHYYKKLVFVCSVTYNIENNCDIILIFSMFLTVSKSEQSFVLYMIKKSFNV